MTGRYVTEDYEVFPDEPEGDYWNDDYIPPYYEELDFDKDPETEYLPEEDLTDEDYEAS
jgi:hypothetical protein